jgi:hypothetical protein
MGLRARRAPRRSLSSTARSGMVRGKAAPIVPATSRISPVGTDQFGRYGKFKLASPGAGSTLKRLE